MTKRRWYIILTDHLEDRTYDLMWSDYVFYSQAGTNDSRFTLWLQVKAPEITTDIERGGDDWGVQVIGAEHSVMLRDVPTGAQVYLFSVDGKLVSVKNNTDDRRMLINVPTAGVYNVRVLHGGQAQTFKAVVK